MPIYVYAVISEHQCSFCEGGFEYLQKLNEPALEACPDCGGQVTRKVTAASIPRSSPSLAESNIGKHGFTQYRKVEKGKYEKTVGTGPELITDKNTND